MGIMERMMNKIRGEKKEEAQAEWLERIKKEAMYGEKRFFKGLETSKFALEDIDQMKETYRRIKKLNPKQLKKLKEKINEMAKGADDGGFNNIATTLSAIVTGLGVEAFHQMQKPEDLIVVIPAILSGGTILVVGLKDKLKEWKEKNKRKREMLQAYTYISSRYSEDLARNIFDYRIGSSEEDMVRKIKEYTGAQEEEAKKIYDDISSKFNVINYRDWR